MNQGSNNLHFFYGADGSPAVVVYNGAGYGYVKNLQGDIVSIVNSSGTEVVHYSYDAWGKLLGKTGTLATSLGTLNPFRYRGYVYDEETGLYYLRSRYYNPSWGRFVNADVVLGTGNITSFALFTYCNNNPITQCDKNGFAAEFPGLRTLIHNDVCDEVVNDINNNSSVCAQDRKGMKINFLGFGFGFADVIAVGKEETVLYEIKRFTVSLKLTVSQVDKYLHGVWVGMESASVVAKVLTCKKEADPYIKGSFTRTYGDQTYYVSYADIGHGVVIYDYYTSRDVESFNEMMRKTIEKYGKFFSTMLLPSPLFPVPIF